MKILANCPSKSDPYYAFTYRTTQFPELVFSPGDRYIFNYANGESLILTASRKGDTLYLKDSRHQPHTLPRPQVGLKVEHEILSVYKELKTAVKIKKAAKK